MLFLLPLLLCACPYSSSHYIDDSPQIYVEEVLLGKWIGNVKKPGTNRDELIYLNFAKKTDTEYSISFSGNLKELSPFKINLADSLTGTAFMSTIGERQFLNISINARIYIAELILKSGKLSLLPLAEHFTAKMIRTNLELRNSVDFHYKTRVHPILDDDFCLHDMVKVD